jgi:DNA-binding response OmpR family regulator
MLRAASVRREDPKKVLVVEDEVPIAEAVAYNLRKEGYQTLIATTGELGLSMARTTKPDLIILDIMLPGLGGFDVCRAMRRDSSVPIIMMTARAEVSERVRGLEIGADDYVSKPFDMSELLARVKTVLRRSSELQSAMPDKLTVGALDFDLKKHEARLNGKLLSLSRKEFGLLTLLAAYPGQVFSRTTILDRVWGPDAFVEEHTVNVHVRWIRMKIEDDPAHPKRLLTVRGVGYKLSEEA